MSLYLLLLVPLWFIYRWFKETKRVPNKSQKHVLITGCDTGFGNLLARHLDKLGFCVIAACYTEKGEDELKKACSERLKTLHLDVTSQDSINKAVTFLTTVVGEKGEWGIDCCCLMTNTLNILEYRMRCHPEHTRLFSSTHIWPQA